MDLTPGRITVLTVDDHPLVRDGIAALIAGTVDMELVGEASDGAEAIERVMRLAPDVTLMDIQMPGMSGIDAIVAIRQRAPAARLVVLTTYKGDVLAQRALRAGAQAYLLKSQVRTDLLDTIRAVNAGQRRINPEVAMELAHHTTEESLSDREIHVLRLIALGNSNKHVARALGITEGTVKSHVKNILAKLQATDRTHAVTLARDRGIIGL
jgi:DNA-binding NarL/FixJ family response regulator